MLRIIRRADFSDGGLVQPDPVRLLVPSLKIHLRLLWKLLAIVFESGEETASLVVYPSLPLLPGCDACFGDERHSVRLTHFLLGHLSLVLVVVMRQVLAERLPDLVEGGIVLGRALG